MSDRDRALDEVVDLVTRHALTLEEIAAALRDDGELNARRASGILSRLFAYVGGAFVFTGLAIYIAMRWDDLGPPGRVILTLGPGFCTFILALVWTIPHRGIPQGREVLAAAATPLFLIAALVQPTGILVTMREYSPGGDPAYGVLLMNLIMGIQQGCSFWATRRTVLAFTTIVFATGFCAVALDLLGAGHDLIGVVLGVSLGCIAWSLDGSPHRSIAALVYFAASLIFLSASYDAIRHTALEVLFVGFACSTIFLATVTRSRTLLVVGTVALIAYIGTFMAEHFENSLNAPVFLMLVGLFLMAIGAVAVRINNKYIRQSA